MLPHFKIIDTQTGEYYDPDTYIMAYGRLYWSWRAFDDGNHENPDSIKMLRSTEVDDRKGTEIFEGHIVHLTSDDGMDAIGIITFKNGAFCVVDSLEAPAVTYQLMSCDYELEVIGDIYNDKALLENISY